jgi:hypothetical protein
MATVGSEKSKTDHREFEVIFHVYSCNLQYCFKQHRERGKSERCGYLLLKNSNILY